MTWYWFPDNTVLSNFASVGRLPLLEETLRGRGRWVEAIAAEAARSAHFLPDLASIAQSGWLGAPIEINNRAEIAQIERVRRAVFGGSPQEPLRHLGEAQTCHVILNWPTFVGSYWLTDDRDAQEYARRQGITTRDTMDVVSEAVVEGCCSRDEGFKVLHQMLQEGNYLRVPGHPSHL
jgi:predicted nucleic acid-binding protein